MDSSTLNIIQRVLAAYGSQRDDINDSDCGDDEHGKAMSKAYTDRLNEVFRIMLGMPAQRAS